MIHDLGVFTMGLITGAAVAATFGYARWVSAALDRTEP